MAKIYTSADQLVGGTPLLELTNLEKELGLKARILAKLEYLNPAGSVKDRVAKRMIEDAEARGDLKEGSVIIEPTSGNTGIGLAAIAAAKGYRIIIVMPETMSVERRQLMKAYGAELVLTDGSKGMTGAIEKANELAKETPGGYVPGQFVNPSNPAAHRETTGPEIYRDTVSCYSYSKSLSLPGERIGYVYVPQKATDGKALYSAVAGAARAGGHVCAPSLWQKVIARCAHLRPDLESYDRNRKALYEGLTRMGYEMAKPDGAFYLFIKAPGGDANAFSDAAKKKDLLVVPGDGFGCPGYFRICYCVSLEMIQKSLPVFEELIRCGEW